MVGNNIFGAADEQFASIGQSLLTLVATLIRIPAFDPARSQQPAHWVQDSWLETAPVLNFFWLPHLYLVLFRAVAFRGVIIAAYSSAHRSGGLAAYAEVNDTRVPPTDLAASDTFRHTTSRESATARRLHRRRCAAPSTSTHRCASAGHMGSSGVALYHHRSDTSLCAASRQTQKRTPQLKTSAARSIKVGDPSRRRLIAAGAMKVTVPLAVHRMPPGGLHLGLKVRHLRGVLLGRR